MTRSWNELVTRCVAVGGLMLAAGCAAPSDAPLSADEAQAIRDTVTVLEDGMNRSVDALDCQSGLKSIGDRAPIFVSGGIVVRTQAMMTEGCGRMVQGRTGAAWSVDTLTAHALSANAAYVVREGRYTINRLDGTDTTNYMVMTTIWERQDTSWKMVHLHESWRPLE